MTVLLAGSEGAGTSECDGSISCCVCVKETKSDSKESR